MTIIEKILASHCGKDFVKPGEIVDVAIDVRMARDFGGAGVVNNLLANKLPVKEPDKTFFTFDCNPGGSDQQYAANQQKCRLYARDNGITVYDINAGIGTHLAIDEGLAVPGATLVSTDSHANILGAIGAFGQGMGDRDIAAAWSRGSVWFKVPESVKIHLTGERPPSLSAKDIALNLLGYFGADGLLGYSVEMYGDETEALTLDERITISSMATEMGAIALIFPPSSEVAEYCRSRSYLTIAPIFANPGSVYHKEFTLEISGYSRLIALPGQPHEVTPVEKVAGTKIDSVFVGSCTNGRMEDMRAAAGLLKGRKVAPGVVLKIVPATDEIWINCLNEGLIGIFKAAGALVSNAGCAGCASGQVGQNGPGEKTVSTGNRNFEGKQGKGEVYLASVSTAVASAIAGHITTDDQIPVHPSVFTEKSGKSGSGLHRSGTSPSNASSSMPDKAGHEPKSLILEGKVWLIRQDNIDTDMIYHNRYLAVTDFLKMGQYALGNLKGWEDFAQKAEPGDMIIAGRNFGSGSSRQQAVDCFKALNTQAILAGSFGAIYERNAINAGFPVLTYAQLENLELRDRDVVVIDMMNGLITNKRNNRKADISKFSEVQRMIYEKGDLLRI